MKHFPSLWFSLSVPLFFGVGCRGPDARELAPSGLAADPEGCRSFATLGGVDVGGDFGVSQGEQRCGFDAESAELRCDLSLASGPVSSVVEYASLADFVEAGHTLGKLTSLAETRVESGRARRVSHRYDELGRLVRSLEEGPGQTLVTAYSDYDGEGRPRHAIADSVGAEGDCGAWLVSIEYADAARTVARRSRPRDPARCGFVEHTLVERYDDAGNRIGAVAADATGVSDSFAARAPSASERVCL
jgi:hypothetical protein